MGKIAYYITKKDFKKINKLAENVYNIAVVLDYFCTNNPEKEELLIISSALKELKQNAEMLNALFKGSNQEFYKL